jgi:hypothetical protein
MIFWRTRAGALQGRSGVRERDFGHDGGVSAVNPGSQKLIPQLKRPYPDLF